ARGNAIVTAREVHERGAAAALERVPEGGRYYLAVDVDGFDPSVVPGTAALAPGGLSYWHGLDLVAGLQRRGQLVGLGFAARSPDRGVNGRSARVSVRLGVAALAAGGRRRGR